MFSGTVTDKVKGSIILPTIAKKGKVAGDSIEVSEEQFWGKDIQTALRQGFIVFTGKVPAARKVSFIQNVSNSSVILGKYGVIRSGSVKEVENADLKSIEITSALNKKVLKIVKSLNEAEVLNTNQETIKAYVPETTNKEEDEDEKNKSPVDQKMRPVVVKPKDTQEKSKKDKRIKKVSSDDLLIDNDGDDEQSGKDDDIIFVDVEQSEKRISEHPILRKKAD